MEDIKRGSHSSAVRADADNSTARHCIDFNLHMDDLLQTPFDCTALQLPRSLE